MSISQKDLYLKHIEGLRLEDELMMRCLEADTRRLNNYSEKALKLAKMGKGNPVEVCFNVGVLKREIDKGYEELKRRVMKEK